MKMNVFHMNHRLYRGVECIKYKQKYVTKYKKYNNNNKNEYNITYISQNYVIFLWNIFFLP